MATLKVGRVGLATPTLEAHQDWISQSHERGSRHRISGWLQATSLAESKILRTELIHQTGQVIAVTYSGDDSFDGFYKQISAAVDARAKFVSLQGNGLFPFDIELEWIGDHSNIEFLSNYTGLLINNDHGLTVGECQFFHSPPVAGDDAYTAGGGVTAVARTTEDGSIPVFLDVPLVSGIGAARWGCAPSEYYDGAARIDVGGYTRTGLNVPNLPAYWVVGNGLIELRGETAGGSSIGDISIRGYNSGWGSWIPFDIVWNSTADIPEWMMFSVIRNDPACVVVQLVRDADEAPPTDSRHWLTISLRRGAPMATLHYTYSTSVALTVDRATLDAGTAITPTGASSAMAVSDAADDGDSNRWIVGGADVSATDTTNGGIDMASAAAHGFFLGMIIGGSGAGTDDDGDAICRQWLAQLNEDVQTIVR